MKKINPKITTLVILIMTLLLTGGIAVEETVGPGVDPGPGGGEGGT